jgi:hypothetical protein
MDIAPPWKNKGQYEKVETTKKDHHSSPTMTPQPMDVHNGGSWTTMLSISGSLFYNEQTQLLRRWQPR